MHPLLARTVFRLQERLLGRRTFAILRELEASQYWPRERIEELRLARLREVLAAAWEHVPYWRRTMEARGIAPGDVTSLADLREFPLLEKETLRARREEMVWREAGPRLQLVRTSGSTNEALQFYTNSDREAHINAARIRGHRWVGINKGDKEMYFWGSPVELTRQDRIKRLRDRLSNDGLTRALNMTPQRAREYVEQWRRWRPRCLFGYPSSFALLVRMAEQEGIDLGVLKPCGLKAICTTSEMLVDVDRQRVADAFGVPVYDSYGLREAGLVGHECEHGTMHTIDEQVLLETIDPETLEPTDGAGELVITNLVSLVEPIIRYRTGDMVRLSADPCECGRNLHRVRVDGGRIADFLVTSEGRWVSGITVIYNCRAVKGIVQFQARQEQLGEVRILLETDESFPPDGVEQLIRSMRAQMESKDKITVELVEHIAPAPSGKYRPVVSKVAEQLRQQADGAAAP